MNENQVHVTSLTTNVEVFKQLSDATADMGSIPTDLQKMTDKIHRSSSKLLVSHESEQARRSLVVG
jgi:hypothetical protein